ncbi:MAG: SDR family NAD(P)-dependent oxidoreductase [Thermoleophilia bacterium]
MLDGKVCIVTGGANGMGRATAIEMARQGARRVVVSDVKDDEGAETVALVEQAGGEALYVRCNQRVEEEVIALMRAAVDRFGGIDVLHNNAAVHEVAMAGPQPIDQISNELWDAVIPRRTCAASGGAPSTPRRTCGRRGPARS